MPKKSKSSKPRLFIPDFTSYFKPFEQTFDLVPNVYAADVVMFTGGEDVDPALYNDKKGKWTITSSGRDLREKYLFDVSLSQGKKFLGICRGAQFLCAMAGGKLAQHISGHGFGDHRILTNEGEDYYISTLHHQMMIPFKVDHELIAWTEGRSQTYLNGDNQNIPDIEVEPEIVYFPKIKALGIQGHPEFHKPDSPINVYLNNLVKEKLL